MLLLQQIIDCFTIFYDTLFNKHYLHYNTNISNVTKSYLVKY